MGKNLNNHVTLLLGEPCTGKSKVIRTAIDLDRDEWEFHAKGLVRFHVHEERRTIVIGRYDEEHQFPGTDRLSMGVQPQAIAFIRKHTGNYNIIFEGARMGNLKMIRALEEMGVDLAVYELHVEPETLAKRRALERDQTAAFVKRCRSTIDNIKAEYPYVRHVKHTTSSQNRDFIAHLRRERRI